MYILKFILELIGTVVLADFVSGFVHWAEDTFGTEETPIIGKWIVVPNVLHHEFPSAFTKKNWVQSSWDLLLVSIIILIVSWAFGFLTWYVWLFCILEANANQIHKYAHLPQKSIPIFVRVLQKLRLLQNAKDHAIHHRGEKNTAYCVITPYLNPVLDMLGFWRFLERISVPILGAPRREDLKNIKQPIIKKIIEKIISKLFLFLV